MSGDTIPNSLPQNPAMPHAVPRIGAGNASGVHPYSTALNSGLEEVLHGEHALVLRTRVDHGEQEDGRPHERRRHHERQLPPDHGHVVHARPSSTPTTPGAYV